ncbi:hypothetical protein M9434_000310 [Picochlorum sp. BPE23]|nr:hypothetical protein M9434_000310 [Picochlorum sp. BPE23]
MADSIEDGGSHFVVPHISQKDMSTMTREEWMHQYGDVLSSETHYLKRDPDWDRNKKSWWYAMTGRDGEEPPLWMQEEWHKAELDYRVGGDRHAAPVDAREEKPLWAERMNLDGEKQGPQSSTVFGHRQEYLPAHKSRARSMYDRYQPLYQRIVNDEIPDTAAPPDGRFWKAGVAQGVTTNPYERRMALSGHRKPIVIGPKSIQVVVDGEGHTLANMVRDVAWTQPDVVFAGYSLEHPVYRHMNLRIQTRDEATKSSEHVLVDSLKTTQGIIGCVGDSMEEAMAAWQKDS